MEVLGRRLLDAWIQWEAKPGNEQTTQAYEAEARICATALHISAGQLRLQLASAQRRGVPRRLAVEQALAPLAEGP